MNKIFYILMFAMLLYMSLRNFKLASRYKHNKDYIKTYESLLKNEEGAYDAILEFMGKEESPEYLNKARVLQLYYDIDNGKAFDTLDKLDLNDLYYTRGKIDNEKMNLNSDTTLWLMMVLAKAGVKGEKEISDTLIEVYDRNKDILENRLEYHLVHEVDAIVNKHEDRDTKFLTDLLQGEYEYKYDKQLIGLYKRFAEALLAYEDEDALGEYEKEDLPRFAKTLIGNCLMKNLGILDKYFVKEEEEKEEETEAVEDIVKETAEAVEEAAEETVEETVEAAEEAVETIEETVEEVPEETEEKTEEE